MHPTQRSRHAESPSARPKPARRLGRRAGRDSRRLQRRSSRSSPSGIGFRAVYLSGGALSAGNGVPDIGLLTLTEFVAGRQLTAQATSLPLLCDADTGFGEALNVERTVQAVRSRRRRRDSPRRPAIAEAVRAPVGQVAGRRRRRWPPRSGPPSPPSATRDFVIIARTDARGVTGFDDAVRRAQLYLDAGADAIFPEALESADEFARFAQGRARRRCSPT